MNSTLFQVAELADIADELTQRVQQAEASGCLSRDAKERLAEAREFIEELSDAAEASETHHLLERCATDPSNRQQHAAHRQAAQARAADAQRDAELALQAIEQ